MAGKQKITLSLSETSTFCSQMGMILCSGIPASEGISIMLEDANSDEEREFLTAMENTLAETGSLYEAFDKAGVFPDYMLSVVHLGEKTGNLDTIMTELGEYYQKESSMAQIIKNAIAYPSVMLLMTLAVILLLMMKVIPVFGLVYEQLGTGLSGLPGAILTIGICLNKCWIAVVAILVFLALALAFALRSKRAGRWFLKTFAKTGIMKSISEELSAYKFSKSLAVALTSGLTPSESFSLAFRTVESKSFREKLQRCRQMVEEGEEICDSLLKCNVFSKVCVRLLMIGRITGNTSEAIEKISILQEESIDSRLSGLIASIEPALVIILSLIAGLILLSVMLPLINVMSAL